MRGVEKLKENIIKDRLKSLREEKLIYQKDLADKLHISRAAIASYETFILWGLIKLSKLKADSINYLLFFYFGQ